MAYELKPTGENVATEELNKLSARTPVRDERLYLLVRDGVDYSAELSGSLNSTAEGVLVVSYSGVNTTFDLRFIDSDCCGVTIWTFGPKPR